MPKDVIVIKLAKGLAKRITDKPQHRSSKAQATTCRLSQAKANKKTTTSTLLSFPIVQAAPRPFP
jgi:hypothetical protein